MRRRTGPLAPRVVLGVLGLLTLAYFEIRMIAELLADHRAVREVEAVELLYDAEILARTADGTLRAADLALLARARDLAARGGAAHLAGEAGGEAVSGALAETAALVPEASVVLLADVSGKALAAHGGGQAPVLELPAGRLARLGLAGGSDVVVGRTAAGGPSELLLLRAVRGPGPRLFLAAAFPAALMDDKLGLLSERKGTEAVLVDMLGAAFGSMPETAGAGGGPAVEAEVALRGFPLRVRARRDLSRRYAEWRGRALSQALVGTALFGAFAAAGAYLFVARSRSREADDLERRLEERELLFHEVNHRVKNNLTIVSSILALGEEEAASNPAAGAEVLRAAAERVQSVALLHERLYAARRLDSVALDDYFEHLAEALRAAYGEGRPIAVVTRADPGLALKVERALPVALAVTELATNAFKHAFPDGRSGTVVIEARAAPGGGCVVTVADDGVGDARSSCGGGGFGETLVAALAEQVKAKLSCGENPACGRGVSWTLELPPA